MSAADRLRDLADVFAGREVDRGMKAGPVYAAEARCWAIARSDLEELAEEIEAVEGCDVCDAEGVIRDRDDVAYRCRHPGYGPVIV